MLVDPREAAAHPIRGAVRYVEVHVGGLVEAHLAEDGAADHITGGKLVARGVVRRVGAWAGRGMGRGGGLSGHAAV